MQLTQASTPPRICTKLTGNWPRKALNSGSERFFSKDQFQLRKTLQDLFLNIGFLIMSLALSCLLIMQRYFGSVQAISCLIEMFSTSFLRLLPVVRLPLASSFSPLQRCQSSSTLAIESSAYQTQRQVLQCSSLETTMEEKTILESANKEALIPNKLQILCIQLLMSFVANMRMQNNLTNMRLPPLPCKETYDFSNLITLSFVRQSNLHKRQKFGIKLQGLNVHNLRPLPKLVKSAVLQKSQGQSQTKTLNRIRCCGFQLSASDGQKEYKKKLSLLESAHLIQKYNFVHLKNYFQSKLQVQEEKLILTDSSVAFEHHELEDPKLRFQPSFQFSKKQIKFTVEMPALLGADGQKQHLPRTRIFQHLSEQIQIASTF